MLNLSAARLAIRRDPDEAEAALRQAEESGRRSMSDIRRVVGRLGEGGAMRPEPGARDVPDLVRGFADAGLEVHLSTEGDVDAVPPAVGLALYRIVQESIANVVKHAPGATVDVTVAIAPTAVPGLGPRTAAVVSPPTVGARRRWLRDHRDARAGRARRRDARRGPGRGRVVRRRRAADRDRVIRVLLVDDQPLVREGLRRILHVDDGFEIVAECDDGDEVVDAVARARPDVVVMDIRMKRVDGVEATDAVRALADGPPVLVLTTFDDDEILSAALRAGAAGFQLKDAPGEELIMATARGRGGRVVARPGGDRAGADRFRARPPRCRVGRRARAPHATRGRGPPARRPRHVEPRDRRRALRQRGDREVAHRPHLHQARPARPRRRDRLRVRHGLSPRRRSIRCADSTLTDGGPWVRRSLSAADVAFSASRLCW